MCRKGRLRWGFASALFLSLTVLDVVSSLHQCLPAGLAICLPPFVCLSCCSPRRLLGTCRLVEYR
jgi:hypothetical protein